jgi:hypothetical protein
VKDLQHRCVLSERRRLESAEAVRDRGRSEPLQQYRPQSFAVKAVVDGERHFRRRGALADVRTDRDRPRLAVDVADRQQRQGARPVAGVAEPFDEGRGGLGQREKAPVTGCGGQIVKKTPERLAVLRS